MKSYSASTKKIFIVFLSFIFILGLIFSFTFNKNYTFSLDGLLFGITIGTIFGFIVLLYGLGQKIYITSDQITYSASIIDLFFPKKRKVLQISEVKEIALGSPQINKKATFAAINIRSTTDEISFNPDLFDQFILNQFITDLKNKNSSIKMDTFATQLLNRQDTNGTFRKTALVNFIGISMLLLVVVALEGFLYMNSIISKQVVLLSFPIFLFLIPFIYNSVKRLI